MTFATLDPSASTVFQSALLDNLGSTHLMVVDWFGLSESNLPHGEKVAAGPSAAGEANDRPVDEGSLGDAATPPAAGEDKLPSS